MPGTVLLLAAAPLGRGRLVDAAGVLPVLAAVAPAVLSGTDTANVVELVDPLEPQAVLTRLRAAAAAPAPLTVYIAGQLQLDRRQRLPHLALARTTPATVRYTALPWHWIREELRLRSAGDTALVLDLHADAETWQYVAERGLDCGRNTAVYGRVAAGAGRRGVAEPAYMKAVATLLRSGHRPSLGQLHEQAWARAGESGAGRDLVLAFPGGSAPRPPFAQPPIRLGLQNSHVEQPVADPHAAISARVQAGRYPEADALAAHHEAAAVRSHGTASEEALHWSEVRADLAMLAGDSLRSCRAWLAVAGVRLAAGQAVDSAAVEAAVDRAHHQWGRIKDPAPARELGSALAELRLRVPGRRSGALENVQQHLRQLQAAP
ncbi:hypothetical protein [Streptomyces roseochromogenus]|uniref:Uncharacterized protein n=1 Tax=Streptomyces roseochromogenus subsp. oscitans DS 12.976 TaxID=1352936 RepID=V6KB13_STRRC|nr:hypothetical protein [Streptomyces roseochromogenus]EST29302.1 hypothetical protein M878_20705 [Streptomyces roseochromogenus subsp. oscitans DS 12.976]